MLLLFAAIGLTAWGYAGAAANPQGGEYLIFWGLGLWGTIRIARGYGNFLRVDGIQQRRRAGSRGDGTSRTTGERANRANQPESDPDAGPWSPRTIGWAMLCFGPLWAGLVAALNWRRLDHTARYRLPIAAGSLGSVGLLLLPSSNHAIWLVLTCDLIIGLIVLVPQQRLYQSLDDAGGPHGRVGLPILLIMIGMIPLGWAAW